MTSRKIHYVWEGSAISKEHVANILLALATADHDVTVTVWTSRPMSIMATLTAMEHDEGASSRSAAFRYLANRFHKYLRIGDTRSLYARLKGYLPEPGQAMRVAAMFEREISGPYRNYAAASDWTRVVLLLVEGGTYLDVDVVTFNPAPLLLGPTQPDFLIWNPVKEGGLPNGLLAARRGAPDAKRLLENMLKATQELDRMALGKSWHACPPSWGSKRSNLISNIYPTSIWTKTGVTSNADGLMVELPPTCVYGRLRGTVLTTGPSELKNLALDTDDFHLFPDEAEVFHSTVRHVNQWHFDRHAPRRSIPSILAPRNLRVGFDASSAWSYTPRRRRASTPSLTEMAPMS